MRFVRPLFTLLLWLALLLLASASAAGSLAAQLGRTSLAWDVLAQFAPLWLLAGLGAMGGSLLLRAWRRWTVAGLALVGVIAAAALIAPEYLRPAGPQAPAAAPDQLKVVQFNIWHENPDPAPILAWLDAEAPDIAVIEENSPRFRRALSLHGGWAIACPACEVLILSRRPALEVDNPPRRRRAPPAPLTRAVFRDQRGPFEIIGVHNAWPTDPDQPYQERRLAAVIATAPKDRLIVTGDFNSTPWSFARRRWDQAFGIPRRERAVASWPAHRYKRLRWVGMPFLPIDHVYAGPGWATVSVRRGPRLTSDHYPLVVNLAPVAPR